MLEQFADDPDMETIWLDPLPAGTITSRLGN